MPVAISAPFTMAAAAGSDVPTTFWREEYRLNARISRYPKPYAVIMDGIVMGGGVGISVYGSHRIVTERTRFAMPETGIGFFPDIGASWFLTRQAHELGTYIGLTGEPLGAADAILAGLADVFIRSERLADLTGALAALPARSSRETVSAVIAGFSEIPPTGILEPQQPSIDRLFAFDTIEDIIAALRSDDSLFPKNFFPFSRPSHPLASMSRCVFCGSGAKPARWKTASNGNFQRRLRFCAAMISTRACARP